MQSMFRLPWCTDHFGPGDKATFGSSATPPNIEIATSKKLKRKRAVTPDMQFPPSSDVKRQRPATAAASGFPSTVTAPRLPAATPPFTLSAKTNLQPKQTDNAEIKKDPQAQESDKENMTSCCGDVEMEDTATQASKLRQAIENQLNLQILMKHNELRLIDQELAKCQIALEQLRRCEMKPYPGDHGFDYAVSCGTGAAILPAPGYTRASHAPPHGVVDGPYTRHYRRWLLPDAQFDSQPIRAISPVDDAQLAGRSTRHAGARKSVAIAAPSRYGDNHQSLSSHPAPAARKDSSTPLVLRRSTDNKLVKLVCNNCNRGNMSSIQGFLNHCRIAHKVIYDSHDAAAIDCGHILDDAEIANLPAEAQTLQVSKPLHKPVVKHTTVRTASAVAPVINTQTVHPLNQPGAAAVPKQSKAAVAKPVSTLR